MPDTPDALAARRWFRQRLEDMAAEHPQLATPESQARLDAALGSLFDEENRPCPDDSPQADPAAGR